MSKPVPEHRVYRVLDANLNRLREGLRVIEEYFRFCLPGEGSQLSRLKEMRHALQDFETEIGRNHLLARRDSEKDPLSEGMSAREEQRAGLNDLLAANLRRCQESARVLEEYGKVCGYTATVRGAKEMRFSLYTLEKRICADA
ncbi:MAG: hypothetical protein ACQEQV_02220 [Fibrobacterota bacterium]